MTAPADGPDDEALMLRVQAGDRTAYGVLVSRHLGRTVSVAQRVLHSRADAEEVAQDVFLTVWQKPLLWQAGKAKFATWLYRVAINRALDVVRKVRPVALPEDYDAADPTPGPVEQRIELQRQQQLAHAVAGLPDRQRAALALSYQTEMSDVDAAAALGVSVKAYESLLVRARKALREKLKEGGAYDAA